MAFETGGGLRLCQLLATARVVVWGMLHCVARMGWWADSSSVERIGRT